MEPEGRHRNVDSRRAAHGERADASCPPSTRQASLLLRGRGFIVVTAHNGAVAKADCRTHRSRVMLLTGYPHTTVERRALGADMFLTTPCLSEVLERRVTRLRRRSGRCSGAHPH